MVILDPKKTDKELEKLTNEIKGTFSEHGFTLVDEDVWGHRTLAYKIKGHTEGYYLVMNFEGESEWLPQVQKDLRLQVGVIRYLLTKVPEDYVLMRYEQKIATQGAPSKAPKQKLSRQAEEIEKKLTRKKKEEPKEEEPAEEEKEEKEEITAAPEHEPAPEPEAEEPTEAPAEAPTEEPEPEAKEEDKEEEEPKEDTKLDEQLQAIIDDTDIDL